jgi:hypothetical protein
MTTRAHRAAMERVECADASVPGVQRLVYAEPRARVRFFTEQLTPADRWTAWSLRHLGASERSHRAASGQLQLLANPAVSLYTVADHAYTNGIMWRHHRHRLEDHYRHWRSAPSRRRRAGTATAANDTDTAAAANDTAADDDDTAADDDDGGISDTLMCGAIIDVPLSAAAYARRQTRRARSHHQQQQQQQRAAGGGGGGGNDNGPFRALQNGLAVATSGSASYAHTVVRSACAAPGTALQRQQQQGGAAVVVDDDFVYVHSHTLGAQQHPLRAAGS